MADLQKFLPQADVAAERIKAIVLELKEAFDNYDGDLGDASQRTTGWDMIQQHILQEENIWDDTPGKVSKAVIFYGDNWMAGAGSSSGESDEGKGLSSDDDDDSTDEEGESPAAGAPPEKKVRLDDVDEGDDEDDDGLFEGGTFGE